MPGRRRGRTGRGWDAAPPRPRSDDDRTGAPDSDPADGSAGGRSGTGWPVAGRSGAGWSSGERSDGGRSGSAWSGGGSGGGWSGGSRSGGSRSGGGRPGDDGSVPGEPGDDQTDAETDEGPDAGGSRRGRAGSRGSEATPAKPVDPAEQAREICLRLLSFRPRTRQELATALRQRGIAAEVADQVLDRYDEVGIIDDQAFARAWVTSRHYGRGLAGRALANELRRKGVDAEAVGEALAEIDSATEAATARDLVDRKLRTDRGGPAEATFRRLVGMLARKGYPAGLAIRVVKDAIAERAQSGDIDAGALADADLDSFDPELMDAEAREAESDAER